MFDTTFERIFLAAHHKVEGQWTVNLDSLRQLGAGALNLHSIPGLRSVELCEVLTVWKDLNQSRALHRSNDLFQHRHDRFTPVPPVSSTGKIGKVTFHFHFTN